MRVFNVDPLNLTCLTTTPADVCAATGAFVSSFNVVFNIGTTMVFVVVPLLALVALIRGAW